MISFFARCTGLHRKTKATYTEKRAHVDLPCAWAAPENALIFQGFEWHVPADQSHWNRLRHALSDLKSIGVDQIWVPPGCKGMDPAGNGYDIYDLFDLGEFDQKGSISTKWGSKKELVDFIREARSLGIGIVWDAVLNHKAGADFPERFKAIQVDPKDVDGWVGFDFSGRGEAYSSMKYHWQHFTGVDWDDKSKQQAIYKIVKPGKGWASDVSTENGNYDYLMFADLDHSHPEVRQDLLNWGTWITDELSLSGMRLDAAKHFSTEFQKDFVAHVQKTSNQGFFVIGEYWTGYLPALLDYLDKLGHTITAYDVPLLENFSRISHERAADLRGIFDNTLVQCRPDHAVTIVSNHDTTPIAPNFKLISYALILLRKGGFPCLFYGDVYGIRANVPDPMTPAGNGKLPILAKARKLYAHGPQKDYFDQPNCIGFTRGGTVASPGLACIISNARSSRKRMFIGRENTSQTWVDILGHQSTSVVIDRRGYGIFPVGAMSVSVWVDSAAVNLEAIQKEFNLDIFDIN
ncbi:Glycoside hydrolase superfamily [Penicillium verhagenii]|uniref:Glycoside hydrolase superfamily n=1 Tax=Penicillium verhagenii TaxID=1562060 RepID=UPI0025450B83|nr:Glycoside hydrolase superfamily [Penicillium verhagenii]KAJ5935753.1 Glycoside hydrolase superfamily [Penicillium verhagenii]